jgi:hypothetical protein
MKTLGFKIFFIGFNKCGTRSLSECLRRAGVNSVHGGLDGDGYHDEILRNVSHGWPTLKGFDGHDAYLDIDAVRKCFRELDRDYPGSKFVLNTRDMERWVRSRLNHDAGAYIHFLNRKYDVELTWSEWAERWRRDFIVHEKLATDHFANRPHDFLRFDVEKDRPRDLAAFLGLDAAALPEELPREGETSPVKHYDFSGGKIVRIVDIELAVAERDRANEMLHSVIAERESAIAQIHAANAQIERLTFERDRALASRDALFAQRGQLINERDALTRSCDAVTAEIEAIHRSRSWRITAPLRELRGSLRRRAR